MVPGPDPAGAPVAAGALGIAAVLVLVPMVAVAVGLAEVIRVVTAAPGWHCE